MQIRLIVTQCPMPIVWISWGCAKLRSSLDNFKSTFKKFCMDFLKMARNNCKKFENGWKQYVAEYVVKKNVSKQT